MGPVVIGTASCLVDSSGSERGFDHSVANTALFSIIAFKEGIDAPLATAELAISLLGNRYWIKRA